MDYSISLIIETELLDVAEVLIKCWRETYMGIINQSFLDTMSSTWLAENWKTNILDVKKNKGNVKIYVLKVEQYICGLCIFGDNRHKDVNVDAEINAIYVLQKYQKQKLGLALFEKVKQEFKNNNKKNMIICVLKDNIKAHKFYEKIGGIKIDYTKKFIIHNQELDEISYYWDL